MAKDMQGVELNVGNRVLMSLDKALAFGDIVEIRPGGIITGMRRGASDARPGVIVVICRFETIFDPTNPICANMARMHDLSLPGEEPPPEPSKLVTM